MQRFFKSAAHVDPQQEQPLLPDKRASTARSENCILITVAEDLDYDDLASYITTFDPTKCSIQSLYYRL